MPKLEVRTVASKVIWTSPDGQRKIHELQMDYKGKPVKANTFSDAIAVEGWSGEVETYEREGKGNAPAQTFVKQPQKDGSGYPSNSVGERTAKPAYKPKDEKAIQAMWSIGQAVQLVVATKPKDILGTVEAHAQELFLMVDRVKAVTEVQGATTPEPDVVIDPDQTTIEDIKEIFGEAEAAAEDVEVEDPWQPKT